jgi:hypothetical protein
MAELWIIFTIVLAAIIVCSFMLGALHNVGSVDTTSVLAITFAIFTTGLIGVCFELVDSSEKSGAKKGKLLLEMSIINGEKKVVPDYITIQGVDTVQYYKLIDVEK